jgi:site-specific DNA-cytosine methylase
MWAAALNTAFFGDTSAASASDPSSDDALIFRCLWCCEFNRACQEELLSDVSHAHPEHVFADVLACVGRPMDGSPRLGDGLSSCALRDHILNSPPSAAMWCVRCGKFCRPGQADLHIAGSPCQDFSVLGSRAQISGSRSLPFYCWCRQRLHIREPFILHENVVAFGTQHVDDCLASEYSVVRRWELCPSLFGWASKRRRQFVILVHKAVLLSDIIPANFSTHLDSLLGLFYRECKYGLLKYAGASESELTEDLSLFHGFDVIIAIFLGSWLISKLSTWFTS